MADGLSERYQDLLTGSYDCVDRIVEWLLSSRAQRRRVPPVVAESDGATETLDDTHLMRLAGRFS